ncbi:DUF756 domain-containing protein [Massilia sp. H-1]|nr:DUF756 domain-containing protein [Massilia sp. H-1]
MRALPYVLHVTERVSPGESGVTLTFASRRAAAAVFHVYDRINPAAPPRRYTVAAFTQLDGYWPLAGQGGAYDLWVLGPGGFHRQFA